MRAGLAGAFLALATMPGVAVAGLDIPPPVSVASLDPGAHLPPIRLSKVVIKLSRGEYYGHVKSGLICLSGSRLVWKSGRTQLDGDDFGQAFDDALGGLGYPVVASGDGMFRETEHERADYLIGATVTKLSVDACLPRSPMGDYMHAKGAALLDVEWQVFSRREGKVVATGVTHAGFTQKETLPGGLDAIVLGAFAENARAFAATGRLREAISAPATPAAASQSK